MPSTPESEETRVTDAEVRAATNAVRRRYRKADIDPPKAWPEQVARVALEAAAALHPPREGAEAEHKLYRSMRAKLATTEAALAESRGEVERLKEALMEIAGLHYGVTREMARTALRGGI